MSEVSERLRVSLMDFRKGLIKHPRYLDKLTVNDMAVLWMMRTHLAKHPENKTVGIAQIGSHLKISKPAITQCINRLENKGVVERVILKSDRRAIHLMFTARGKEQFEREKQLVDNIMKEIVVRMGEEDTEKFIVLLDKFKTISQQIGTEYSEKEKKKA